MQFYRQQLMSADCKHSRTGEIFFCHSNWVELGKREPYSNLIKPDTPVSNIADSETCRKCNGKDCTNNILEEIMANQKLTSGYFGFSKPKGKCSHGGTFDLSSWWQGGINKDTMHSSHGYLHEVAALVATAATRELLEDIRAAIGDAEFLRLMGLSQTSVLCFVIDTTGSMSDDIAEVRRVASSIIDSKKGNAAQQSEYILVPFNDPDYGPLTRTTDPHVFKQSLNALVAHGGGDAPEMCLSGLQLALTGSPPGTEIFVFTDDDAKDKMLRNTVQALIERTKSVVTFMLTNNLRRRRRSNRFFGGQQFNSIKEVYQDLAQASGGHAIRVTKRTLPQATGIILDTSRSALVTLFQAVRTSAKHETFSVLVDFLLQNLIIYITGNSLFYTITSPLGISQSNTELNGALGIIHKVGNFHTLRPNISTVGLWLFSITSTQPYTIKIVGKSEVDFLFDFVELSQGLHPSYVVLNSRPAAQTNVTLLVSMIGGDNMWPTEVSLVEASHLSSLNGTLVDIGSGQYLVTFNSIPAGEFTVHMVGQTSFSTTSNDHFQRQSATQFHASSLAITTEPVGTMNPGKPFTLLFRVATSGSGGTFNIRVTNDRNFETYFKTSLALKSGGSANVTVTIVAPGKTPSGTDVTVTIFAVEPYGRDFNYAVLRLPVVAPVTDFTPPVCEAVNMNANCSGSCSFSSWYLTANVTDGSGIQSVRVLQGNGHLNTTTVLSDTGRNVTMVVYSSSCCTQELHLVAVDSVGNVATCFKSMKAAASPSMLTCGAEFCFLPVCLWSNLVYLLMFYTISA
ncbi:von Willebrand factor A domain-containing protein 7-like [Clarias gariepinus]